MRNAETQHAAGVPPALGQSQTLALERFLVRGVDSRVNNVEEREQQP